jgi:hypothetical protein
MDTIDNIFLDDPDDDLKNGQEINDAGPGDDGIGENSEQTELAKAIGEDEEKTPGKEDAVENNRPGATNQNENDMGIPTVTPDNDNLEAGPKRK